MSVDPPLLAALALICVHLFAARGPFRRLESGPWLSFASGGAAAYVFLYILPHLNVLSAQFAAGDGRWREGEWIFVAALAGTCTFHVLDAVTRRQGAGRRASVRFWTDVGAFALYNLLVGALFVIKPYVGIVDVLVHQSALVLHFAAIDTGLRERHPRDYDRIGRWIMAAAIAAGWTIGQLELGQAGIAGATFAFLAGGMIVNVLKEELSASRRADLAPFLLGAAAFAGLFLLGRML